MRLHSLGYRSDLIFHEFEGEVTDRGSYLVVRTPSNPTYRWGNYLIFDSPPQAGDLERWEGLFAKEIGTPPETSHLVFGWDGTEGETGDIAPFLAAGFELEESIVLSSGEVKAPPKVNHDIEMRPLETDGEFAEVVALHVASQAEKEDPEGYRLFYERSMVAYRKMIAAGMGHWFGAFLGGRLVADMGLFWQGGLARYQSVATHPDYRRRGICGTLTHWVGRYGLERAGVRQLVIVADAHYHAAGIYESVGLKPTERQVGVEWREKG